MNDFSSNKFLTELIRYNNWANAQIFARCIGLTDDQLAASTAGSYGSIHRTLGHIIYAEADYIGRMTGDMPEAPFEWEKGPSVGELAAFATVVAERWLEVIRNVPLEQMVHEVEDGQFMEYQAAALYIQLINHGIEHRTNITTILSSLGLPAPEIDGWGFLSAHPEAYKLDQGLL